MLKFKSAKETLSLWESIVEKKEKKLTDGRAYVEGAFQEKIDSTCLNISDTNKMLSQITKDKSFESGIFESKLAEEAFKTISESVETNKANLEKSLKESVTSFQQDGKKLFESEMGRKEEALKIDTAKYKNGETRKGIIKWFDASSGDGSLKDAKTGDLLYFHKNALPKDLHSKDFMNKNVEYKVTADTTFVQPNEIHIKEDEDEEKLAVGSRPDVRAIENDEMGDEDEEIADEVEVSDEASSEEEKLSDEEVKELLANIGQEVKELGYDSVKWRVKDGMAQLRIGNNQFDLVDAYAKDKDSCCVFDGEDGFTFEVIKKEDGSFDLSDVPEDLDEALMSHKKKVNEQVGLKEAKGITPQAVASLLPDGSASIGPNKQIIVKDKKTGLKIVFAEKDSFGKDGSAGMHRKVSSLKDVENAISDAWSKGFDRLVIHVDEIKESGEKFKKLEKELAKKGAEDPAALAAWIGRNKLGKEKFQKMASAGKSEDTLPGSSLAEKAYNYWRAHDAMEKISPSYVAEKFKMDEKSKQEFFAMVKSFDPKRKMTEAGEMSQSDIEKDGDWHDVRKDMEMIARMAGLRIDVQPFDQYQGPKGVLFLDGKKIGNIWALNDSDGNIMRWYFDGDEFEGEESEMIDHLMSLKQNKSTSHVVPSLKAVSGGSEKTPNIHGHLKVVEEYLNLYGEANLRKICEENKIDFVKIVENLEEAKSKIKAQTLSVLGGGESGYKSVNTHVEVGGIDGKKHSANLTLRFDRGDEAMLAGFPQDWSIHDDEDANEDGDVYISSLDEIEILRQLKKSLEKQFKDPSWDKYKDEEKRKEVLDKIDAKIDSLE